MDDFEKQDKSIYDDAVAEGIILAFLEVSTPEQRLALFENIRGKYCIHCGDKHPEGRSCQCMNDE